MELALAGMPSVGLNAPDIRKSDRFSLKNLLGDGILWAVPKHRRTIEKRLNRKFGLPGYNWKPLVAKTNLRSCNQCGHDHELGVLCRMLKLFFILCRKYMYIEYLIFSSLLQKSGAGNSFNARKN